MCKQKDGRMYTYYMPHTVLNGCRGAKAEDGDAAAAPGVALQLITRVSTSLKEALRYHMALVAIRQRTMLPPSGLEHLKFEDRFRKAVDFTLNELNMDASEMDLKFVISLRVLWIDSSLRTPPYSVVEQMQDGLADWRALDSARGRVSHRSYVLRHVAPQAIAESWAKLRQEYLRIMTWFGRCPCKIARRLDRLQQHHSVELERQLQKWNQVQMAAEERHQKQAVLQAESIALPPATDAGQAANAPRLDMVASKVLPLDEVEHRIYRLLAKWRSSEDQGHGEWQRAQKRKSSTLIAKATCRRYQRRV